MNDAFKVQELTLPGVLLITPRRFGDGRGFSTVPYSEEHFAQLGITTHFLQDYTSYSVKGVIRGLHFQRVPYMQDKLVRCSSGKIMDVAADCDPRSPTYGTHVTATLAADTQAMLYIPGQYVHGFCVVSEGAVTEYKMSAAYTPTSAGGVRWDDPLLSISWPVSNPILSDQDKSWPLLQGKK